MLGTFTGPCYFLSVLHPPISGPSFANTPSGRVSITLLEQRENQPLHWPRMCNLCKKLGPGQQHQQKYRIMDNNLEEEQEEAEEEGHKEKKTTKQQTHVQTIYKWTTKNIGSLSAHSRSTKFCSSEPASCSGWVFLSHVLIESRWGSDIPLRGWTS